MTHDLSLEPILQAAEPRVLLVRERYLRQVLDFLRESGRNVPFNLSLPFWTSSKELDEAKIRSSRSIPKNEPLLLLITDPHDRSLSRLPKPEQLLAYWRLLFQAAVMREIDRKIETGLLTVAKCREKLSRFGQPVEREIRFVIGSEKLVVEDADSVALYRAFAAMYLDLNAFEKHRIEDFFPSLPGGTAVLQLLSEDLDATALLTANRPAGSASPPQEAPPDAAWLTPECFPDSPITDPEEARGCPKQALDAEKRGNFVRAAILHTKLASTVAVPDQELIRQAACADLNKVVSPLGDLFGWDDETCQEWRQAILPLLEPATRGFWPRAARCLYELQRIPKDLSREVYAVDLPEYLRTFGRRPLKRPLTHARPVLLLMHLKKAHSQMSRAGLDHLAQLRLDRLFLHQINILENAIRQQFTPIIMEAFTRAGLNPTTTVETVGRDKLVAELLDRVCERGFLRLADLRDAVARNRLKLPDLHTVGDMLSGDGLLRVDLDLNDALDGVYRKGEFYLRILQKFSALFFGTKLGRLFTVFVAIPFGGAFLSLMFAEEVHLLGSDVASFIARKIAKPATASQPSTPAAQPSGQVPDIIHADHVAWDDETNSVIWYPSNLVTGDEVEVTDGGELIWSDPRPGTTVVTQILTSSAKNTADDQEQESTFLIAWPTILCWGFILLLVIHIPVFRRSVFWVLGYVWWAIRGILWDIPASICGSPIMRGFRQSHMVRFLLRHFWSPTLITLLLFIPLVVVGFRPWFLIKWGWVVWGPLTAVYNLWGWELQDKIAEAVSGLGRYIRTDLIPGVLGVILNWIKLLGNWIERQLYAVDEWLRFRGGDSQGSLYLKALLSLLWFPLAYMFRFVFYLLFEPQINPLKHFPVVTVSHKVIWPMLGEIQKATGLSKWTVAAFINGIPGIFGFMAWELKENWRLYKANIPLRLKPVVIGSHGETMRRLLRPGFHSGTVPNLFRKLRHADRAKATRLHHDLDHLAVSVEQFAEREFIDLLHHCPEWGNIVVQLEDIRFGCRRLMVKFAAPGLGRDHFAIAFENVNERVEATVEQTGWVDKLTVQQHALLIRALRGMMDMAAVEAIDGKPRVDGSTPLGPAFDDLARTVAWSEWVESWNQKGAKR